MNEFDFIIDNNDPILITGSNGFIGSRVVKILSEYGFRNLRCLVRPSSNLRTLNDIVKRYDKSMIEIIKGNLLSIDDCERITKDIKVIFHLAAGVRKIIPGMFFEFSRYNKKSTRCYSEKESLKTIFECQFFRSLFCERNQTPRLA